MKGSDASWKGDMEPPPGYEEYSDDEEERRAKKERKESRMKALAQEIVDLDEPARKVPSFEERMNRQNTMRNQLFSNHHMAPLKRPDWFRNAAPGAGRPMPDGEGSSKGNVVRASNFTVPPFHRQAPPTPPSFPFSSSNSFRTSPPGGRPFSIRNNQMQSKFFSNPSTSNIFPPQNQMNGNPFSPSRPQASFSPNGQAFPANSQGFQSTNSGFQANVQNFSPQNSQAFQRNASPFRPVVGGFSTCNQSWSSNSHTFGGQPSFSANTHSFPTPSLNSANSPGFPQNHPCKHRNFDNQGLQSNSHQFPLNNSCGTGNFQQNGFMPDNPPFPQIFPPNCSKYPPQPGQNFQPPQRPGNAPFGLPNSRSFSGTNPSFQSQNHFSSPNQQQASQFLQNNQFFPTNMPSFQQRNPPFSQGCRSFPPK